MQPSIQSVTSVLLYQPWVHSATAFRIAEHIKLHHITCGKAAMSFCLVKLGAVIRQVAMIFAPKYRFAVIRIAPKNYPYHHKTKPYPFC